MAANIDAFIGPKSAYSVEMQIEGRLDAIYVHGEKPRFYIFDALTDRGVPCKFSEDEKEEAITLLQRRVRVLGTAHFNKKASSLFRVGNLCDGR